MLKSELINGLDKLTEEDSKKLEKIILAIDNLVDVILQNLENSPRRNIALTKLEECYLWCLQTISKQINGDNENVKTEGSNP